MDGITFSISSYGELKKYNETLSVGRCRIFYKYGNRNGTYITDEFADLLISSLPYTPVKGIYDSEGDDYTDHGKSRNLGRIYGIVPENPNFAWEEHTDEDGVTRTYACCDVYYYTALYSEAEQIFGKSQSMELYKKSIAGDWRIIEGKRYYVFTAGCFLGLQVLGDNTLPCFEGSAFYSLERDFLVSLNSELQKLQEEYEMDKQDLVIEPISIPNFKLSDGEKYQGLWKILNPGYNAENDWEIVYNVCDVYDKYAVCYDYANGNFVRAYYTKDDATDSISVDKIENCYILDVNEYEKMALETLQKMNGDTYEKIDELYQKALDDEIEARANLEKANNKVSEFEQKIEELTSSNASLITERDTALADKETYSALVDSLNEKTNKLTEQNEELSRYRNDKVREEKQNVISSYAKKLSNEILEQFTSEIDNYDMETLKMKLAYTYVESNPNLGDSREVRIPVEHEKSGIERILSKYKNIGG